MYCRPSGRTGDACIHFSRMMDTRRKTKIPRDEVLLQHSLALPAVASAACHCSDSWYGLLDHDGPDRLTLWWLFGVMESLSSAATAKMGYDDTVCTTICCFKKGYGIVSPKEEHVCIFDGRILCRTPG